MKLDVQAGDLVKIKPAQDIRNWITGFLGGDVPEFTERHIERWEGSMFEVKGNDMGWITFKDFSWHEDWLEIIVASPRPLMKMSLN